MKIKLLSLSCAFFVAFTVPTLFAQIAPGSSQLRWAPGIDVGVPGGIPNNRTRIIDVTHAPYNADPSGARDSTDAIQAAVRGANAGDIVFIPAGTFLCNGSFGTGIRQNNITIRGAGMDVTFIDSRSTTAGISFGVGSSFNYPVNGNIVSSGLTRGSTTLAMGDTSAFSVGELIRVEFDNQTDEAMIAAGHTPVLSVSNFPYMRRQMTRIVGKSNSSLTISPAIYHDAFPGCNARVTQSIFYSYGVGLEDLTILNNNGSAVFSIQFLDCVGSWVKNVKSKNTSNYHLHLSNCLQFEVRGCVFSDRKSGGSNGAGLLMLTCSGCLIEDNIIEKVGPNIEVNHGSSGNVFAYNVFERSGMNVNHGPHNSLNLYEGNITQWIQSDGYFGSASDDTFFRNWIHGTAHGDSSVQTFLVSLNRFTRRYSLIGNILGNPVWPYGSDPYSFGNPNMGNSSFSGTSQMSQGRFPADWKMTGTLSERRSNTTGQITLNKGSLFPGQFRAYIAWGGSTGPMAELTISAVSGNVVTFSIPSGTLPAQGAALYINAGIQGYQEKDLDVAATTLLRGNYHAWSGGGIPASQSLAGQPIPTSLFRSSKPGFFGDLDWPAFDPTHPVLSYNQIPAGYRFVNGRNPPGVVQNTPTPSPQVPVMPSGLQVK